MRRGETLRPRSPVFERHGYAAGTTNRIAARAGVSIGSLYQYSPSKDAILLALVERHVAEGEAALGPLAGWLAGGGGTGDVAEHADAAPSLRDGLQALVAAMMALHADRPALHRVLFEEAPRPPELRRRLDALAAAAAAVVASWLRGCDEVRVADAELAAALVVQTIESVTHTLVIHPAATRPAQAWADATVDMLAGWLTAVAPTSVT